MYISLFSPYVFSFLFSRNGASFSARGWKYLELAGFELSECPNSEPERIRSGVVFFLGGCVFSAPVDRLRL